MSGQDDLYKQAVLAHGPALDRLATAYEADSEDRRDLLQEIQLALRRSFESFDGRCSLRTWVYRVAHNAATSHVLRSRRRKSKTLVSREQIEEQRAPRPKTIATIPSSEARYWNSSTR
jgi:RNA polymerase sigma-70 factor (ECF subfamily)